MCGAAAGTACVLQQSHSPRCCTRRVDVRPFSCQLGAPVRAFAGAKVGCNAVATRCSKHATCPVASGRHSPRILTLLALHVPPPPADQQLGPQPVRTGEARPHQVRTQHVGSSEQRRARVKTTPAWLEMTLAVPGHCGARLLRDQACVLHLRCAQSPCQAARMRRPARHRSLAQDSASADTQRRDSHLRKCLAAKQSINLSG